MTDPTEAPRRFSRLQELEQEQRELDARKCVVLGHDTFTVLTRLGNGGAPHRVMCDRCHQSWAVVTG